MTTPFSNSAPPAQDDVHLRQHALSINEIQLVLGERNKAYDIAIEKEKVLYRILFFLITNFVATLFLISDGKMGFTDINKGVILFFISQLEVVLCLSALYFISKIFIYIGYIKALENKINSQLKNTAIKTNIFIWQSVISERFIFHGSHRTLTFLLGFIAVFLFILSFGVSIYFSRHIFAEYIFGSVIAGVLITIEICGIAYYYFRHVQNDRDNSFKEAQAIFDGNR